MSIIYPKNYILRHVVLVITDPLVMNPGYKMSCNHNTMQPAKAVINSMIVIIILFHPCYTSIQQIKQLISADDPHRIHLGGQKEIERKARDACATINKACTMSTTENPFRD